MKNIIFSLFFFFSCMGLAHSQIAGNSIMELKRWDIEADYEYILPQLVGWSTSAYQLDDKSSTIHGLKALMSQKSPQAIPSAYSYNELGLFCKFEVKLEKAASFPVKIRLGEVQQVERLEGKWQYQTWQNFVK